jgi:hypothetical protein
MRGIIRLTTLLRSMPNGTVVLIPDPVAQELQINEYLRDTFDQVDGVCCVPPRANPFGEWLFERYEEAK